MAFLSDPRPPHLRISPSRTRRTAPLSHLGISRGSSAIRRRRSGPALLHIYRQTSSFPGRYDCDDAGNAGRDSSVLVFCEAKEDGLTTKDTKGHEGSYSTVLLCVPSCPLWLNLRAYTLLNSSTFSDGPGLGGESRS